MGTTTFIKEWRKLFCCCLLLISIDKARSQNTAPVATPARPDGHALVTMANRYFEGKSSRDKALVYSAQASRAAWTQGDSALMAQADRIHGRLLFEAQRLPEAATVLTRILPVAERHASPEAVDGILDTLGLVHIYRAHYDVALKYFFKTLSRRQQRDDALALATALHHTGMVFYRLKNYEKALDHYQRALDMNAWPETSTEARQLSMDIYLCYTRQERHIDALAGVEQALAACDSSCTQPVRYAAAYIRGTASLGKHDTITARKYFAEALRLAERAGDVRAQAETSIALGNLALAEGDFNQAKPLFTKAEALAAPGGQNLLLAEAYAGFIPLYRSQQNYERTTHYQEKFAQYRDSVFDERIAANLTEAQATFEDEQNRLAITLKDEVIRQQRVQGIFIISGVVLLSIVALVLLKRVRRRRALRKVLEERVAERTTMLEDSVQRWEAERRVKDAALMARAALITSSLTALKKVCADVLADQPDENTKECVDRMVGVIEEMEGSVGQGVREIVRTSSPSPSRKDAGPSLNLENPIQTI